MEIDHFQRPAETRKLLLGDISSTAPTTMEVRPPKFLHGFGRAQGSPRPSPNAGTAADGTLPQPFSQAA